jgi:hypothetical protein
MAYVIVEERLPGLRGGVAASAQESRHGSFRDLDTQLEQLPLDAGCSPKRVGRGHLQDQSSNRRANFWTSALPPGNPGPEQAKARAMPTHYGLRSDEDQRPVPILPALGQPHPKEAIRPSQPRPRALSLEHGELLTKGQVLQGDISEVSGRNEKTKQQTQQRKHGV